MLKNMMVVLNVVHIGVNKCIRECTKKYDLWYCYRAGAYCCGNCLRYLDEEEKEF